MFTLSTIIVIAYGSYSLAAIGLGIAAVGTGRAQGMVLRDDPRALIKRWR